MKTSHPSNPVPDATEPVNRLPAPETGEWAFWSAPLPFAPCGGVERADDSPAESGFVLGLHGGHFESYGRLIAVATGVEPGRYYRFSVWQRTRGVDFDVVRVPVILSWLGGGETLQRDYIEPAGATEGWQLRHRTIQAPAGAESVRVELGLRWSAGSSVWWAAPRLTEASPPSPRKVRIATTRILPPDISTVETNTRLMAEMFDKVAKERPDLVLFSENLVDCCVRLPLAETAQPILGPLTEMLSEKARCYRTYVATTLHEVDKEGRFYNTAVLIDREGAVVGRYHKIHLTMTEAEGGIVPGYDPFVFDADFGKIGMMICWDNWFPEAARLLRLRGAEILLLPIAGDGTPGHWEAISRARAFDNGVYLVSSTTFCEAPSQIVNPAGEVLAETTGPFSHAVHEIDLNRQWRIRYLSVGPALGEGRSLYVQERRPDLYGPLSV